MSHFDADRPLAVTETARHEAYRGFRKVDVISYREDHSGIAARREIVVARPAVAVICHDPKRDRLVMVRQFRYGAQMGTGKGWCAEVVAGLIDDGEDPANTVRREVQEEAGVEATHVRELCCFLTTPGMSDEVIHLYYAQVDSTLLPEEAGVEHETEQTFPFALTLDEAMEAVDNNRITNGIAMLALMWFARHRTQLTEGAK
ncbi:MAG: NUDIX hydrolase [Pseudomonadota bacterium]